MESIKQILDRYDRTTSIPIPIPCNEPAPLTQAQRIGVSDMGHTFASYKVLPGNEKAVETLRELAEGTSPVPFGLVFGGVGNGKSHLLEAVVIRLNERGLFSRYYTWADVIGLFKSHLDRNAIPSFDVLLKRFCESPRLIIDDLGMGLTDTAWEQAQLETIIDYRYRYKLFTVLATNKDLSDLPDRVRSRLSDKSVCALCLNKAGDYRRLKKGGREQMVTQNDNPARRVEG